MNLTLNQSLSFITVTNSKLTISPIAFNSVGIYYLQVRLQDTWPHFSDYLLTLEVGNTLPRFARDLPQDQILYLNDVLFYSLPTMIDAENHTIYVKPKVLPSFVTLNRYQFTF